MLTGRSVFSTTAYQQMPPKVCKTCGKTFPVASLRYAYKLTKPHTGTAFDWYCIPVSELRRSREKRRRWRTRRRWRDALRNGQRGAERSSVTMGFCFDGGKEHAERIAR